MTCKHFFNNDEARAVVTCMLATPPSIKDYYWPFNNRIAQVKVPAAHLDAYKQHPEWEALTDRLTTIEEIHAIAENSETSFSGGIDENTDLSDTTVGNVYITLDDGDGYDPLDGCIVLNSTMEEEYAGNIGGCIPGQSDLANRFNGLVIMVSAGDGTVAVDCKTVGCNRLAVKIGDNEPQYYTKNDKA